MSRMKRVLCAAILFVLLVFVFHAFCMNEASKPAWQGAESPGAASTELESSVWLMLTPVAVIAHERPVQQQGHGQERFQFLFFVFALFACRRAFWLWQRRVHIMRDQLCIIDFCINHPQLAPPCRL
ncbi:MAG: hypothetical protein RSH26_02560 [Clostridia bacterium]